MLNATFDIIQEDMIATQSCNRHVRSWLALLELIRCCRQIQFGIID